jgi:autotransporter-associated beta strand protein
MKNSISILFAGWLACVLSQIAQAGSATWKAAPTDNKWATASNWTPATVPNGSADTATFDVSSITAISIFNSTELAELIFNPGASSYTITAVSGTSGTYISRTFSGAGIINNSGVAQTLVNDANSSASLGHTYFTNSAGADNVNIINNGSVTVSVPGVTSFFDSSTAATSIITNRAGLYRGTTEFLGVSTAAEALITNDGTSIQGQFGGDTVFYNHATAGSSRIIAKGGAQSRISGAYILFHDDSSAGKASLLAEGLVGRAGAIIYFNDNSDGDSARVEVSGTGNLDISGHSPQPVTIGSLEGNGLVFLGRGTLSVGSNNLSTTFSGVISDRGSLTKVGRGILTLSNANNTYTGGTTVQRGTLLVTNEGGSATGTGPVNVDGGTLAGTGTIEGAVTLGSGTEVATLSPGKVSLSTMTIKSTLTFDANSVYDFAFNSGRVESDGVLPNGVTINSGATFSPVDIGDETLPAGTVFNVIYNTSATPISGTFSNLADGSNITIGNNTFQANYEGGNGNDLTLTVIP